MFFQRDYILRMIEMMGDLMRRIAELLSDLARVKLLDDACRKHAGISLETAESLTAESLEALLQTTPRLMMSEILFIRSEAFSLPMEQRESLREKSLRLLASLHEEGPLCELRAERLLLLKNELLPKLTAPVLLNCARFFNQAEWFDHMEDALFQAAELSREREEPIAIVPEGAEMLKKAALASPRALALAHTSSLEMETAALDLLKLAGERK